jgi:hypothetical protein
MLTRPRSTAFRTVASVSQRTTTRRSALSTALSGLLAADAASLLPGTTSDAPEPVSVQQHALTIADVVDSTTPA